jgi:predicted nicotinamide N-methyase
MSRSAATATIGFDLESELGSRFATREECFNHGALELRMLLPRAADELLDEEAFSRDERLPYWADLWPSAKALGRYLLDKPPPTGHRIIELGCGLALPSLILHSRGFDVLATDYNKDALLFASVNGTRNGLGSLSIALLDWRQTPDELGPFDLAIAADVLYEQRNAISLVGCLPRVLSAGGRFMLADPGRRWLGEFRARLRQAGWTEIELTSIEEPPAGSGSPSTVRLSEWKRR